MLADVPVRRQWQSYLRFHTVDGASPYLSDAFVSENFDFYGKTLRGQKEIKPRWKRVLGTIEQPGRRSAGPDVRQGRVPGGIQGARWKTLVANLRTALKARIENLDWMSDDTKKKAIEKWATFTPKIGYPDKWRDWTGLSTSRDSYIGNVLAANEFNYKWNLGKIGKPVDKTEWGMSPQTVNAYYNPLQNEIVFPAAILQPPFFDAERHRRDELRRHRRGDRPRDDPRLRRPGQPLRADRQLRELVDAGRRQGLLGAHRQAGRPVRRLRAAPAAEGQRQADPGREHRRPRRPGHRLRRDEEGRRQDARIRRPTA